ncbi:hypothetical protein Tco_0128039 [Tanacetum coccineum]
MTRSSTKELFTPFKNPEREIRSSRKLFKTLSLDESRLTVFDLFSDVEENSEEEVVEKMAETMEEYMSKTRAHYESSVARPKIDDNDHFELKDHFLKELRDVTFSGLDHEDANEHIEKFLRIVDLFLSTNNNLGREIKKVNEKVYAAQVRYELCKGPHYTKDCPLKEEAKRHEENSNLIKEIQASTYAAIRNQGSSIKTFEIQIGQMSKVLQEIGFGGLPSSTETNLRDHDNSISPTNEADTDPENVV